MFYYVFHHHLSVSFCSIVFFLFFLSPQGNVTFSCAEPLSVSVTFTDSHSFLQLPGPTSWSSGVVSVALQFRTWNKAGLLLTFDLPQQEGIVFLYLSEARLRLQISKADRALLELSTGQSACGFGVSVFCFLVLFFFAPKRESIIQGFPPALGIERTSGEC